MSNRKHEEVITLEELLKLAAARQVEWNEEPLQAPTRAPKQVTPEILTSRLLREAFSFLSSEVPFPDDPMDLLRRKEDKNG